MLYRRDLSQVRVPTKYYSAYREFFRRLRKTKKKCCNKYIPPVEYGEILAEFGYEKQLLPLIDRIDSLHMWTSICQALTQPDREIIQRLRNNPHMNLLTLFLQLIHLHATDLLDEYFQSDPNKATQGESRDYAYNIAFQFAVRSNYFPMILRCLETGYVVFRDGLIQAILHKREDSFSLLVSRVNTFDTRLIKEAIKADFVQAYQRMSTLDWSIDYLARAIECGSRGIIRYILEHQWDTAQKTAATNLYNAVIRVQTETVHLLIDKGVDATLAVEFVRMNPCRANDYYNEEKQDLHRYLLSLHLP